MRRLGLTGWILVSMILGLSAGLLIHQLAPATVAQRLSDNLSIVTDIFLRLIKMIIAPLVFTTMVVGIAKLGDVQTLGRVGGKTLAWFIGASLLSLLLGMAVMNLLHLGSDLKLPLPSGSSETGLEKSTLSFRSFITHVFPRSFVEAMANNEILQIVVFSLLFGLATASLGEKGKILVRGLDAASQVILRMTGYIMRAAPLAAFAAIAAILSLKGGSILLTYGKFILVFYGSILLLWLLLGILTSLVIGRRVWELLGRIKGAILLAFSTASSEAAFPKLLDELEKFGCPPRIVSFVLPLGYSFNLDGSMLYMTFASLFIAQAYNIPMDGGQQLSMLLVLMLSSKGIAGVPRAALVVVAGTLSMYNIPQQGLLLLLGIDQILDMARSATNVVGNSLATAAISKMEGALGPAIKP